MCPIHCLCSFLIYVYSMTLSSLPALLKLLYFPSSWGGLHSFPCPHLESLQSTYNSSFLMTHVSESFGATLHISISIIRRYFRFLFSFPLSSSFLFENAYSFPIARLYPSFNFPMTFGVSCKHPPVR